MRHRLVVSVLAASMALGGAASAQSPVPSPAQSVPAWEVALDEAEAASSRGAGLLAGDPVGALAACREAWSALARARDGGIPAEALTPVEQATRGCLDTLHSVKHVGARLLLGLQPRPGSLVQGPGRYVFFISDGSDSVWRVDTTNGAARRVLSTGEGPGAGVGIPRLLAVGGRDLVILDDAGDLWRWRWGNIARLRAPDEPVLGDDVLAMDALVIDREQNRYNLYLADPSENQILRFSPELRRRGFSDVSPYLASDDEDVPAMRDLHVDQSLYTLKADGLTRHYGGRTQPFRPASSPGATGRPGLATPPDDEDLRPGHDYRFVAAHDGRFYIHDAAWSRVLVFDRASGDYIEQWQTAGDVPAMEDLRGMVVADPPRSGGTRAPTLVWLTASGLYRSPLVDDAPTTPEASPSPVP